MTNPRWSTTINRALSAFTGHAAPSPGHALAAISAAAGVGTKVLTHDTALAAVTFAGTALVGLALTAVTEHAKTRRAEIPFRSEIIHAQTLQLQAVAREDHLAVTVRAATEGEPSTERRIQSALVLDALLGWHPNQTWAPSPPERGPRPYKEELPVIPDDASALQEPPHRGQGLPVIPDDASILKKESPLAPE